MSKRVEYKFPRVQLRYPNGVTQIVNWVSQEEYDFMKKMKADGEAELAALDPNKCRANAYLNLSHKIDRAKAIMRAYDIFITSDSPLGRAVTEAKSGGKTTLVLPSHQGGEIGITVKVLRRYE